MNKSYIDNADHNVGSSWCFHKLVLTPGRFCQFDQSREKHPANELLLLKLTQSCDEVPTRVARVKYHDHFLFPNLVDSLLKYDFPRRNSEERDNLEGLC